MDRKRSWKYEKDIFGRKHRKYFLENIFGADIHDLKTFRALKKKLSSDYKRFFNSLNKSYERGEFKNIAKESLSLLDRTTIIINNMIDSGVVNKKDVDVIIQYVSMLNSRKDVLVQKSVQVKALKNRLEDIEKSTGITPEDLNITEGVIRKGARREVKKGREGVLPFLKRTMPRTHGLAGELAGGLTTAALGPFGGIATGAAKDIYGLGKGIFQKLGARKEEKLGHALSPLSSQLPKGDLGRVRGLRSGGPISGAIKSTKRKEGTAVLKEFFNKDAYRAKWTKELLKGIKSVTGRGKGGMLDTLKSLAGPLGTVVAVGGTVLAAGKVGWDLGTALSDYLKTTEAVEKARRKASDLEIKINQRMLDHFNKSLEGAKKDQPAIDQVTERIETRNKLLEVAPMKLKKNAFISPPVEKMKQLQKDSTKILQDIQEKGAENLSVEQQREILRVAGSPIPISQDELLAEVKKLAEIMSEMSKVTKESNKRPSGIREPGIGNPWDTSDPFSRAIAGSEIELEE